MPEIPLLGGGTVLLRPLAADDGPALARGYAELSARSRYLRHLAPRAPTLTPTELAYLIDVDQRDRAAWVLEDGTRGVALGRYIRLEASPDVAEVALTILDPWQGRGLSKLLLAALMHTARRALIGCFVGLVLEENEAMVRLLRSLGATLQSSEPGEWWAELSTEPTDLSTMPAAEALRHYDRLLSDRLA